jgi:predicted membrane channel-forming protein YqfA (hemolysin III family)
LGEELRKIVEVVEHQVQVLLVVGSQVLGHLLFLVNCYFTVVAIVAAGAWGVLLQMLVSGCPCNGKMLNLGFTILVGGVLLGSSHLPIRVVTAAATVDAPLLIFRD